MKKLDNNLKEKEEEYKTLKKNKKRRENSQ